ncbi:MAG: hypothetical protein LBC12_02980 [Nitrososphaerota archaeon]|nr:hypothetical protein [Nitrososphaerota archaeon]
MLTLLSRKGLIREKTFGIKLHVGVDMLGLSQVMFVSTANVTDCEGAVIMIGYAVLICRSVKLFWRMGVIWGKVFSRVLES